MDKTFADLSIDEKIIDLTARATKLWCNPDDQNNAAGVMIYGWRAQIYGWSARPLFQGHFIIYTNWLTAQKTASIEDSIVEAYNLHDLLCNLNEFLIIKENIQIIKENEVRAYLCADRREIVESIGFGD